MNAILTSEQIFFPGKGFVVESPSPSGNYQVVFEDDGDTGYLYGCAIQQGNIRILDALHIYDVFAISDKDMSSHLQIYWSQDGLKAILLINDYPHAVFDFENKRGYCRHGFPPPDPNWTNFSHEWDDEVLKIFNM